MGDDLSGICLAYYVPPPSFRTPVCCPQASVDCRAGLGRPGRGYWASPTIPGQDLASGPFSLSQVKLQASLQYPEGQELSKIAEELRLRAGRDGHLRPQHPVWAFPTSRIPPNAHSLVPGQSGDGAGAPLGGQASKTRARESGAGWLWARAGWGHGVRKGRSQTSWGVSATHHLQSKTVPHPHDCSVGSCPPRMQCLSLTCK